MIKTFREFLLEQEGSEEKPVRNEEAPEKKSGSEGEKSEPEENHETKDITLGKTADGTKVVAKMKLENTLKISPEEFTKIQNMRVTQYERDMLTHMRGEKEYKISKDKDGKCTIFHNNQTLHKLMPVGVFMLPQKVEHESE